METKDCQVRKKYKATMGVMKNQPGIPAMAAAAWQQQQAQSHFN